jgi:hypothetical protein
MNKATKTLAILVVGLLGGLTAFAGAPLKGIDVKLGKNPGGGCAARASDAGGAVNFGVWPKGQYTVSLGGAASTGLARSAQPARLHVQIQSGGQATIHHVLPAANVEDLEPIEIVSDGKTPIVVQVTDGGAEPVDWARVKSHSNQSNN